MSHPEVATADAASLAMHGFCHRCQEAWLSPNSGLTMKVT